MNQTTRKNGYVRGALTFAVLATIMFTLYVAGKVAGMDQAAIAFAESIRSDAGTAFFRFVTNLGGGMFLVPVAVIMIVVLYIKKYRVEAMFVLISLGASEVANELLKRFFARPRPSGVNLIELPESFSFPSGHAMIGPAFYCMVAFWIAQWFAEKRWSSLVQPAVFIFVALLAFSRVYLGVHYLSDVLTGFFLSMCWYFLLRLGYEEWMGRRSTVVDPIPHSR
ncbi:phosphatase PAP2 family protein [Brevibacillus brevis]|uniref:phosphatase PAP2 family protein n=1 Tax=Brevibacillus brevis TaxID=1393 RepID=UPI000D0FC025|nr:phosphatase PAP2 family protein [Brevibacillus brevis]PSJ70545.1 phospholipid phosphatase [Brevibacillus brevis]RED30878.1 undecaprenyl-diphosphatase [Brevibacillus brevis]GEC88864.1 putative lipid phosphate phosphatase YodM [Brevibacillus brevis]VEF89908.1 undecaprenyl pyrophosphate phosphatase [Brevibacillus brevis]